MSVEDNIAAAEALLASMGSGDVSVAERVFAENLAWYVPRRHVDSPVADRASMIKTMASLPVAFTAFTIQINGVTASGDRVAVEAEGCGTLASGRHYNNLYHILFEFHDGKIKTAREYCDTAHIDALFGTN